jgi:hypothetical protein
MQCKDLQDFAICFGSCFLFEGCLNFPKIINYSLILKRLGINDECIGINQIRINYTESLKPECYLL